MYYIYHIPNFVHKDGSIGKIGCTDNCKKRIRENKWKSLKPFNFWEILEEHIDINIASKRERELQKKYGYFVDSLSFKYSHNHGKEYGAKVGKTNVQSGHMKLITELAAQKKRKAVIQYDLDGNFIKEWNSISSATKSVNGHKTNIISCLNNNQKTAYKFIWKYKD